MKLLITFFTFITCFNLMGQTMQNIALDYFLNELYNDKLYKRQCGCPHSFDSTFQLLIIDSSDFKPDIEKFNSYLNLSEKELYDYENRYFQKSHVLLDSSSEYKTIQEMPKKLIKKNLIRFSHSFEKENFFIVEIWIKNKLICPGIIYSFFIETLEKKVLQVKKIQICDTEG